MARIRNQRATGKLRKGIYPIPREVSKEDLKSASKPKKDKPEVNPNNIYFSKLPL